MSDATVKRYIVDGPGGQGIALDPGSYWIGTRFVLASDYDALCAQLAAVTKERDELRAQRDAPNSGDFALYWKHRFECAANRANDEKQRADAAEREARHLLANCVSVWNGWAFSLDSPIGKARDWLARTAPKS